MDRALGGKVASPGATTSEASSSKQEEDAALASGKTDLLLRFFDSSFFTEYIAVTYLWKSNSPGVQDYLCNRLFTLPEEGVQRYVSQLCVMVVQRPGSSLERVVVDLCSRSITLAVKFYWLLQAIAEDSKGPMAEKVYQLRDVCEKAALEGKWKPLPPHKFPTTCVVDPKVAKGRVSLETLQARISKVSLDNYFPQASPVGQERGGDGGRGGGRGGDRARVSHPASPETRAVLAEGGDTFDLGPGASARGGGFALPEAAPRDVLAAEGSGGEAGTSSAAGAPRPALESSGPSGVRASGGVAVAGPGPGEKEPPANGLGFFPGIPLLPLKKLLSGGSLNLLGGGEEAPVSGASDGTGAAGVGACGSGSGSGSGRGPGSTPPGGLANGAAPSAGGTGAGAGAAGSGSGSGSATPGVASPGMQSPVLSPLSSPRLRRSTLGATLDLVQALCNAGTALAQVDVEERQPALHAWLQHRNAELQDVDRGAGVMFPMGQRPARIVRLPEDEAILLNSREKAPFMLFVEVIADGADGEEEGGGGAGRLGSDGDGEDDDEDGDAEGEGHWRRGSGGGWLDVASVASVAADAASPRSAALPAWGLRAGGGAGGGGLSPRGGERVGSDEAGDRRGGSGGRGRDTTPAKERPSLPSPPSPPARGIGGGGGGAAADRPSPFHQRCRSPVGGATPPPQGKGAAAATPSSAGTAGGGTPSSLAAEPGSEVKAGPGGHLDVHAPGTPPRPGAGAPARCPLSPGETVSAAVDAALAELRKERQCVEVTFTVREAAPGGDVGAGAEAGAAGGAEPSRTASFVRGLFSRARPSSAAGGRRSLGGGVGEDEPPLVRVSLQVTGMDLTTKPRNKRNQKRVPSMEALDLMAEEQGKPPPPRSPERAVSPLATLATRAASPPATREEARAAAALRRQMKAVFGEAFAARKARLREASPHGRCPNWDLRCVIVKSGDDCRQELLAVQLVRQFHEIFAESGLTLWLCPYEVLVTSSKTAFIECVSDTLSLHSVKSAVPGCSLLDYFHSRYTVGSAELVQAQRAFVESMAAYSIVSYILQIKDRHNGNILMDKEGHIIHIDFGFMLSNSPGGVNFESAPFKLTRELLEVMDSDADGRSSELFDLFKVLCIQGFLACRKHAERIISLVEIMQHSGCPCFSGGGSRVLANLRKRFHPAATEEQCVEIVMGLISESMDAWRTRQYDYYQRVLNGIM